MVCKNCNNLIQDNLVTCPKCNGYPYIKDDKNNLHEMGYIPAKWWKRFFNFILDVVFFNIVVFIIAFIFALFSISIIKNNFLNDFIVSLIIYFLYYFIFELLFNRTLAKFITRTIVISYENKKPNMKNIAIRTASRFIPFEVLSLISSRPIGWHDSLSKTLVVEKYSI